MTSEFVIAKPVDSGTLTSSPTLTDFPAANVLNAFPTKVTVLTGSTKHFVYDLGSAMTVGVVAALYTNAVSGDTIQVRGATSEANLTAAPGYNSTAVTHWPTTGLEDWARNHAFVFPAQSYQYWRVDIVHSGNYNIGRLFICPVWNPAFGINKIGIKQNYTKVENKGRGGIRRRVIRRWRTFKGTLEKLTETEVFGAAGLAEIRRLAGGGDELLLVLDRTDVSVLMDHSFYGFLEVDTYDLRPTQNWNDYRSVITFTEFEEP